ncbi:MAG: exodeoxyribonuclease VII large subunit [Clostridia bacterium]|nr:exodeoxyribonuclease VII large subunit [Clostridia bacterium]
MEPMSRPDAFRVGQLNEYIKMLLEGNPNLNDIWVQGEISGAKLYSSGHLYFSLKDTDSVISAVMFKGSMMRMEFDPENGMKVLAHGRVSAYPPRGQYQFIADRMIPDGAGALAVAFEQLKARLSAEGLFDPARKRPLPAHPRRIGVVTSPSGAAVHDIIRVAKKRCPSTEILIFPSLVQGAEAPTYLRGGIQYFNAVKDDPEQGVDLIIIGRGGGSAEDLWGFNDERLARAIAMSEIPVVSAVGHEVDFTICDFVADLRAATPSAAAELSLPDKGDLNRQVSALAARLSAAQATRLKRYRTRLDQLTASRVLTSPEGVWRLRRETVAGLEKRLSLAVSRHLVSKRQTMERVVASLGALNPLSVLGRGYALVQSEEGRVIPSAAELKAGERVNLRFSDGTARATIEDTET